MELRDLAAAGRRFWLLIAVLTLGSALIAGALTAIRTPHYTAMARGIVSVSAPQERPPYALASGAEYILERMTSYAELGVMTPTLAPVIDELNLDETPLSLSGHIDSHSVVGKAVVEVAVTYSDSEVAAAIADRVLTHMAHTIGALEKGNIQLAPMGPAPTPTEPSNSKIAINAAVAAAGGFLLGWLVAVNLPLWALRRRTVGPEPDDVVLASWSRCQSP